MEAKERDQDEEQDKDEEQGTPRQKRLLSQRKLYLRGDFFWIEQVVTKGIWHYHHLDCFTLFGGLPQSFCFFDGEYLDLLALFAPSSPSLLPSPPPKGELEFRFQEDFPLVKVERVRYFFSRDPNRDPREQTLRFSGYLIHVQISSVGPASKVFPLLLTSQAIDRPPFKEKIKREDLERMVRVPQTVDGYQVTVAFLFPKREKAETKTEKEPLENEIGEENGEDCENEKEKKVPPEGWNRRRADLLRELGGADYNPYPWRSLPRREVERVLRQRVQEVEEELDDEDDDEEEEEDITETLEFNLPFGIIAVKKIVSLLHFAREFLLLSS